MDRERLARRIDARVDEMVARGAAEEARAAAGGRGLANGTGGARLRAAGLRHRWGTVRGGDRVHEGGAPELRAPPAHLDAQDGGRDLIDRTDRDDGEVAAEIVSAPRTALMRFEKWQALGNDYLIVEAAALPWELTRGAYQAAVRPALRCRLRRHLAALAVEDPAYVAELRIFNPDGSEAELSGNGAREAVMYLRRSGWTDAGRVHNPDQGRADHPDDPLGPGVHAGDGEGEHDVPRISRPAARTARARSRRGAGPGPSSTSRSAIRSARSTWATSSNPSTWPRSGPRSRTASFSRTGPTCRFFRTDGDRVRARIFERGVGETLSSGTGSSGCGSRGHLAGAPSQLTVELDGGELEVEIGDELSRAAHRLGGARLRGRALGGAAGRARGAQLAPPAARA